LRPGFFCNGLAELVVAQARFAGRIEGLVC
jgi:hypothetical protein